MFVTRRAGFFWWRHVSIFLLVSEARKDYCEKNDENCHQAKVFVCGVCGVQRKRRRGC